MMKVTVLYGHPTDAEAFEKYYSETHLPMVAKVQGILKAEVTRFLPNIDGSKPLYYRMAELHFESPDIMQETLNSPDGQEIARDLGNFATGGVNILFGISE